MFDIASLAMGVGPASLNALTGGKALESVGDFMGLGSLDDLNTPENIDFAAMLNPAISQGSAGIAQGYKGAEQSIRDALMSANQQLATGTTAARGDVSGGRDRALQALNPALAQATGNVQTGIDQARQSLVPGFASAREMLSPHMQRTERAAQRFEDMLYGERTPLEQTRGYGAMERGRKSAIDDLVTNRAGLGKLFSGSTAEQAADIGGAMEMSLLDRQDMQRERELARLASETSAGRNLAGAGANLATQEAMSIADLLRGGGSELAQLALTGGQQRAGLETDAANRLAQLAQQGAVAGAGNTANLSQYLAGLQSQGGVNQAQFNLGGQQSIANMLMGQRGQDLNAAQTQAQMDAKEAEGRRGFVGDIIGAGASVLPFLSDRRFKENIEPYKKIGKHQWYSYNYIFDKTPMVGVMAQEAMEITPDAVHNVDGILFVDYARL